MCVQVPVTDLLRCERDPTRTGRWSWSTATRRRPPTQPCSRVLALPECGEASYPPTLVWTGTNDVRCAPWHARKFAARLLAANRSAEPGPAARPARRRPPQRRHGPGPGRRVARLSHARARAAAAGAERPQRPVISGGAGDRRSDLACLRVRDGSGRAVRRRRGPSDHRRSTRSCSGRAWTESLAGIGDRRHRGARLEIFSSKVGVLVQLAGRARPHGRVRVYRVRGRGERVTIPWEVVEKASAAAPRTFTLVARDDARSLVVGEGGTAPRTHPLGGAPSSSIPRAASSAARCSPTCPRRCACSTTVSIPNWCCRSSCRAASGRPGAADQLSCLPGADRQVRLRPRAVVRGAQVRGICGLAQHRGRWRRVRRPLLDQPGVLTVVAAHLRGRTGGGARRGRPARRRLHRAAVPARRNDGPGAACRRGGSADRRSAVRPCDRPGGEAGDPRDVWSPGSCRATRAPARP